MKTFFFSGTVTIGVAKPLPCSTVVGGEKANGQSMQGSQVCNHYFKKKPPQEIKKTKNKHRNHCFLNCG